MAREHSSCLEASRAAALAAHSAAGLAAAAGLREAARLLRSCEALARAATAALQSSTGAKMVRPDSTSAAGQATVGASEVPADSAAPAAGRRKKKKKKKKKSGDNSQDVVMAAAAVASQMSPHAPEFLPGAVAASARVLEKKTSRERSPRREASPKPPSSALASTSLATLPVPDAGAGGFSVGQSALLDGLVARPELSGKLVTLRSFDAAASRWAGTIDDTGESIGVKVCSLRPSIFSTGASAAGKS